MQYTGTVLIIIGTVMALFGAVMGVAGQTVFAWPFACGLALAMGGAMIKMFGGRGYFFSNNPAVRR